MLNQIESIQLNYAQAEVTVVLFRPRAFVKLVIIAHQLGFKGFRKEDKQNMDGTPCYVCLQIISPQCW